MINKLDHTNDAREIHHNLLQVLQHKQKEQELLVPTEILMTPVYASVAYRRAASLGLPVHRLDTSRARGRATPCAAETMQMLAKELFPQFLACPISGWRVSHETENLAGILLLLRPASL